jgi:putative peptide zinc metalloprotease protein
MTAALTLLPGAELLGPVKSPGLREAPYLIRRPDGQVVEVSRLFYLVAAHAQPDRDLAEIGRRAGDELDLRITPEQVRYMLEKKLHPLGVVTGPDGAAPRLERLQPMFGLRWRVGVLPPITVNRIAGVLKFLFLPPVIVALMGSLVAFDVWLVGFHGIGRGLSHVIETPSLTLFMFLLAYASLAFHEGGHAAACRYGGGNPGAIGMGLYIVWPVFYTDVTDSYRFSRRSRLRTDLGGIYFNGVFALAVAAIYLATGFEPLLLVVIGQHLLVLDQFFPWVRLDGYYVVADLLGVSDLFSRIAPVIRSLLPGREHDARVKQLKPWARAAVSTWVFSTIVALCGGGVLLFMNAPHYLVSAWQSLGWQLHMVTSGDTVAAVAGGLGVFMLVLPGAGFLLTYVLVCSGMGALLAVKRDRRRPSLAAGHIPAQKRQVRPDRRGCRVERAYPGGALDRLPVDRLAEQALPGVELRAEEVGVQPAQPGQDADQLEDQREHERAHH